MLSKADSVLQGVASLKHTIFKAEEDRQAQEQFQAAKIDAEAKEALAVES